MSLSLTKIMYDHARFKTPNIKVIKTPIKQEASSSEQTKDDIPNPPIIMDEYGQTPDHFYLARKPPPSFFQVKRKLNLQTSGSSTDGEFKTIKRRRKFDPIPEQPPKGRKAATERRSDTSLGQLTKSFLKLLADSSDGIVNLNTACLLLSVPKRRLYDITNVLEGAGLVQKTSRNNIQWMGNMESPSTEGVRYELEKEIDVLDAKENNLDELIYQMKSQIKSLKETEGNFHYITSDDLKDIKEFSKKMVLGVKISPSGQLIETFEKKMVLTSKSSEIEAFLFTEDVSFLNILHPKAEFKENSFNVKISNNRLNGFEVEPDESEDDCIERMIYPYRSICSSVYNQACSADTWSEGDTLFKNAFISEEDDIAPMGKHFLLQTEDQDIDTVPFADFESPFDNYSFSLDDGEGLTDLFDCQFAEEF